MEREQGIRTQKERRQIILLGDSITQLSFSQSGFGCHLSNIYQRRADVLNRGYAGYNSRWICHYLKTDAGIQDILGVTKRNEINNRICLVTVFLGANDASDEKLNPRHHVPINEYQSNLKYIVNTIKAHSPSNVRIIIISPPPVHHEGRLNYQITRYGVDKATGELERNMTLSKKYADAATHVAQELNLPILNLWEEMQKNKNWGEDYLCDGLHFTPEGNKFVGECLQKLIYHEFPELSIVECTHTGYWGNSSTVSNVDKLAPWHDEIDYKNIDAAFSSAK